MGPLESFSVLYTRGSNGKRWGCSSPFKGGISQVSVVLFQVADLRRSLCCFSTEVPARVAAERVITWVIFTRRRLSIDIKVIEFPVVSDRDRVDVINISVFIEKI